MLQQNILAFIKTYLFRWFSSAGFATAQLVVMDNRQVSPIWIVILRYYIVFPQAVVCGGHKNGQPFCAQFVASEET